MNKKQRKKMRKNSYLEGELRRYVHRCCVLESEREEHIAEINSLRGALKASEAYMIYIMRRCGVLNVDLDLAEVEKVIALVNSGETRAVVDTEKRCIKIANTWGGFWKK